MSRQGFGGDDDDNKSDIERLLDGFSSAKQWYEENSDLFDRFMEGGSSVDLSGSEPISEAHVDEEKVLIVADVSGVNATNLSLSFYEGRVKGKLGSREFDVNVPNDVDEDSIEADMKNGVLRVELDRVGDSGDDLTVESVDHTDEAIGEEDDEETGKWEDEDEDAGLEELFDKEEYKDGDDEGGDN